MTPDTPRSDDGADLTVGVLSLHNSKETKAILNAVEDLGYGAEWLRQENTAVGIDDGTVSVEPDVDVIVNRLLLSTSTLPAEGIGLATLLGHVRPVLNPPGAVTTAIHKVATATALAEAGLPVPDSLLALSGERLNEGRRAFGPKAVYKTAIGTHGGGAWLVELDDPVNPQVGDRQAFLQEFVETGDRARDTRVYVVDGEVVGAMHRYAPTDEWRTNVALGGDVESATRELPEEVLRIACQATEAVGLDYAGVDLIESDGTWMVLEVNPTAGFRGLFEATGTSPAPHIAAVAIERAGGAVDDTRIADLARTLDDSLPACTPDRSPRTSPDQTVIGYIEEVLVSGTRGSEMVLAKSDTGATRTSIDSRLAADIGTGPIKDIVTVRSGSSKSGRSRPVVDIVVRVGGTQHTVTASVEDRSHMSYPLLLGRDVLEHYHVDVTRQAGSDTTWRESEE